MGTKQQWPARRHVRPERTFTTVDAEVEAARTHVTCATCPGVIDTLDDIYCHSCKVHWSNYDGGEDY